MGIYSGSLRFLDEMNVRKDVYYTDILSKAHLETFAQRLIDTYTVSDITRLTFSETERPAHIGEHTSYNSVKLYMLIYLRDVAGQKTYEYILPAPNILVLEDDTRQGKRFTQEMGELYALHIQELTGRPQEFRSAHLCGHY